MKKVLAREVIVKIKNHWPILLLAFVAGIAVLRSPVPAAGRMQSDEERPKFYVDRVISEENVTNPMNILGAPDGRAAEIAVGGRMVLQMQKPIFPSAVDDGTVVCEGEANFGLEGWILAGGTEGSPQYAWMPLVRGYSTGGFRLTSPAGIGGTAEGSPGVTRIRISNDDRKPILVDAVVGYGRLASR
jgi:hypothetical protein